MKDAQFIGIAQMAVARAPEQLCCLGLGSCVGVFIYDPEAKIGGVLHALLPKAPKDRALDTRYADAGTKILREKVVSYGADERRLWAKLVGGAKMFKDLDLRMGNIGKDNVRQARSTLRSLRIRVIGEDVEGDKGRSAYYSLENGIVTIRTAFLPDKRI